MMGQRLFTSVLTIGLMLMGAILGEPGSYPILDSGQLLTPQVLLGGALPVGLLFGNLYLLFQRINQRVNDQDDPFEPGKLLDLLKIEDFWVAFISIVVAILQIFGVEFLSDPETQSLFVSMLMGVAAFLLNTWKQRASTKDLPEPLTLGSLYD